MLVAASLLCIASSAAILLSPFLAPCGSFVFEGGTPGMLDGWWRGHGAAGIPYAIGDVLCHQEFSRSFVLNGSQLPVCMRDTGIAFGAAVGFSCCAISGRESYPRIFAVAGAVLILLMAVEWAVETTGFDSPPLRTCSGACAGIGASLFLAWMLYRESDDRQRRCEGSRGMAR